MPEPAGGRDLQLFDSFWRPDNCDFLHSSPGNLFHHRRVHRDSAGRSIGIRSMAVRSSSPPTDETAEIAPPSLARHLSRIEPHRERCFHGGLRRRRRFIEFVAPAPATDATGYQLGCGHTHVAIDKPAGGVVAGISLPTTGCVFIAVHPLAGQLFGRTIGLSTTLHFFWLVFGVIGGFGLLDRASG
jgi:hypothetical protein